MLSTSSLGVEVGVGLAVLHVGAEAADAGQDRLAVVGMRADLARQREQLRAPFEVDVVGRQPFGRPARLGFSCRLVLGGFAELHVGAEAARAQRDVEAGSGILAELASCRRRCRRRRWPASWRVKWHSG